MSSLFVLNSWNFLLFFKKILQLTQILWFSSIFVYLIPFQQWLYDFEIHLFTPMTTDGTDLQLLQKIQTLTDVLEDKSMH